MATLTENIDIDYIQKDFNSTVDAIISFANVNFGPGTSANRLWTNFNIDSFSRNWLEIVAFVSDVFFFYFDVQATQAYLQTATVRSAVLDIAKQFGFSPATASSASGDATFTVTGAVTIPRGFRVAASNGEEFFVTSDIVAPTAGDVTGSVLQGTIKSETFTAEGLQNEEFDLAGPNVIQDDTPINPLDITPQVVVNGDDYSLVDSLIRFNGEDADVVTDSLGNIIGGGGRVFLLDERPDGTPFIRFGDGVFGRKLVAGESIQITYRTGGGTAGNIAEQTLTTLVDSLPQVTSVTNNADFSGGADEQSIEQLRQLIPASLRTLDRAVAEQDYSDILVANFNEVFAASTEPNNTDPGIDLNIYVVPQGIGIQKISDNSLLQTRLSQFLDRRKMVTVQFSILDAFGVDALIGLEVFITDTASKSSITASIESALSDFFSLTTGGDTGAGIGFAEPILIRDICSILDGISGIVRYEITRLTYRPRIEFNVVGLTSDYNASEVSIFKNVTESEWLLGAAGPVNETPGTLIFDNTGLIAFTYTPATGVVQYAFPVDLSGVSPGDLFKDGAGTDFTILAVDLPNSNLILSEGLTVDNTVNDSSDGSISNGTTSFESFSAFKKTLATATNLSIDSITDNNLDLSVAKGTGSAIASRLLLDNTNVYVPGQYATGDFFLVDSAGNIWEIEANTKNTFTTSITAVNDASVTSVSAGSYNIVDRLVGKQVEFKGSIFNIQYNNVSTIFSIGAQFRNIGTIGDEFAIVEQQANVGNLGVALDLISFDAGTGTVRLNSSPNLQGVNSEYSLIDSSGQIFNVVGVDNRAQPSVFYDAINRDNAVILEDTGLNSQIAGGFQVNDTDTYAVVSLRLKREGNIVGNLTARIVNDDGGGLPDLGSPVAVSDSVVVTDIDNSDYQKVIFSFSTPPTLTASTQYHLVLNGDAAYAAAEISDVKSFDNTGLEGFTYNPVSGVVSYGGAVNLSVVEPGHFFRDGAGTLFPIQSVDDSNDEVVLEIGLTVVETVSTSDDGACIINDRVLVGIDTSSPTYADGEFASFDGASWSNSGSGPSAGSFTDFEGNGFTEADVIFSVEGTKSITVESDLTPVLGPGATVSTRYYDDDNEVSFVLGVSSGTITSAPDVNAIGVGTVGGAPNSSVDNFVFRTSRFADDVVNLRLNEIPQLDVADIDIDIFGGVD